MIRIKWAYIPDYRPLENLERIDLIVCYSGKRYVALNVRHLTVESVEKQVTSMINTLKKDMKDERARRTLRKVREHHPRR